MSNRQEFPKKVCAQIIKRASDEKGNMHCEQCGVLIKGTAFHIDHIIPDGVKSEEAKQKPLTADDGQLLCAGSRQTCHGIKTAEKDIPAVAKVNRIEQKRLRVPEGRKAKMQSKNTLKAGPKDPNRNRPQKTCAGEKPLSRWARGGN